MRTKLAAFLLIAGLGLAQQPSGTHRIYNSTVIDKPVETIRSVPIKAGAGQKLDPALARHNAGIRPTLVDNMPKTECCNLLIGDPPSDEKLQVAGHPLPVTHTSEVKPVQKLAASQVLYSTPIIVGATSPEAAPWTITLGANTNTLTIRSSGGKILAVCNPTSCKEPQ